MNQKFNQRGLASMVLCFNIVLHKNLCLSCLQILNSVFVSLVLFLDLTRVESDEGRTEEG